MKHHKSTDGGEGGEEEKPVPPASLGPAARGNFLEVLNMSLSTFENSYLNRNLDRTGQQSIVITPGESIMLPSSSCSGHSMVEPNWLKSLINH